MCIKQAQRQDQQNEVVINAQREEQNEIHLQNDPLLLENQQNEHHVLAPGEEMAHNINAQLPAGENDALPPPAPPPALAETVAEPKNKKERNIQRANEQLAREAEAQRQRELEEQRRAEEAARRQREREEEERQIEEERQKHRTTVFSDLELVALMSDFVQEKDRQLSLQKAKAFLTAAAKKLIEKDEDIAAECGTTVDYANKMVTPFRLLINTQIDDKDAAADLMEKANTHQQRFEELAEQRPIVYALSNLMPLILKEEFMQSNLFEQAANQIADDYDRNMTEQSDRWVRFEVEMNRALHIPPQGEDMPTNVFAAESPLAYLSKSATIEKFRTQTEQLMAQNKDLSYAEAEKQVFAQHRAELRENAEKQTLNASVVHDVSAEDWKEHGGASFHHVLPAAQAYAIVEKSDGFLYAKPAGNGLCELRPTIPETVQINGETIPLRRSYNLMIKAFMHKILDENGNLRDNAFEAVKEIGRSCNKAVFASRPDISEQVIAEKFKSCLRGAMIEILDGNEAQADQSLDHMVKLFLASNDNTFPPNEIIGNLEGVVPRIQYIGANHSAGLQFERIRKNMTEQGASEDVIAEAEERFVNPDLIERVHKKRMELIRKNVTAPLTQEQEAELSAMYSMYADADAALKEMMAIRNMAPDSLDAPLPNACSSNATFIHGIKKNYMHNQSELFYYAAEEHILAHPQDHINYYIAHIDRLASTEAQKARIIAQLNDYSEKISNGMSLRSSEGALPFNILNGHSTVFRKYDYHQAANLGNIDDKTVFTSETFAAETKQYIVSPFSCNGAVGIYRNKQSSAEGNSGFEGTSDGMIEYYNKDNPLPSDEEAVLVKTKHEWRSDINRIIDSMEE